mgnify:CR=1 FL=1
MSPNKNNAEESQREIQLDNYDVLILDHDDLDAIIEKAGGFEAIPDDVTVFTDDKYTKNTVKFNLITAPDDGTYGVATQLHHPVNSTDVVLDLRDNNNSFADYITGVHNTHSDS